jgi:hypothetical protein
VNNQSFILMKLLHNVRAVKVCPTVQVVQFLDHIFIKKIYNYGLDVGAVIIKQLLVKHYAVRYHNLLFIQINF